MKLQKPETPLNQDQEVEIDSTPGIDKQIDNSQQTETKKATKVNFNFTDEATLEDEMSPVRDILSAGQTESDEMSLEMDLLTVEEVSKFLKATYQVQGWFTFPDLWVREDSFFYDIAAGILPQINAWAVRVPALAHAVKTVSAAGSWGRLIWDLAGTWVLVVRRRQLLEQKKQEEEGTNQNAGYKVNPQQQPNNANPKPAKQGFIIP